MPLLDPLFARGEAKRPHLPEVGVGLDHHDHYRARGRAWAKLVRTRGTPDQVNPPNEP